MHIVLVERSKLPALHYGGTERVVWWLAKGLHSAGHKVTLVAGKGSYCPYAKVLEWVDDATLSKQIPTDADLVHFHFPWKGELKKPYLFTVHGNGQPGQQFSINSIFVSENHAERHGATAFVYNGLDPADYPGFRDSKPAGYMHFLGHAAWKVKNLKGAIEVTRLANQSLKVGGGYRLNLNMGIRFYPHTHVRFWGMVGGEKKDRLLRNSRALVFPVRWHEPFGLAITESMLYGNPVFGTPYGSLPELVSREAGYLSDSASDLALALKEWPAFSRTKIKEWVLENATYESMTNKYLKHYTTVLEGKKLNARLPEKMTNEEGLLFWKS
jgi:glycosyltransferase involved in cell wall biosynthesis